MGNERKNTEQEGTLLYITFEMPIAMHLFFVIFMAMFLSITIINISYIIYLIITAVIYVCVFFTNKMKKCKITNKKIYIESYIFFYKKIDQYRLDAIDNLSSESLLGVNKIIFNYNQGNINKNDSKTITLYFVKNLNNTITALSDIISNIKNDKDVYADLAAKQSDSIASIGKAIAETKEQAKPKNNDTYIDELIKLKKLLDDGIITQEEYDKKKQDILSKKEWFLITLFLFTNK